MTDSYFTRGAIEDRERDIQVKRAIAGEIEMLRVDLIREMITNTKHTNEALADLQHNLGRIASQLEIANRLAQHALMRQAGSSDERAELRDILNGEF